MDHFAIINECIKNPVYSSKNIKYLISISNKNNQNVSLKRILKTVFLKVWNCFLCELKTEIAKKISVIVNMLGTFRLIQNNSNNSVYSYVPSSLILNKGKLSLSRDLYNESPSSLNVF